MCHALADTRPQTEKRPAAAPAAKLKKQNTTCPHLTPHTQTPLGPPAARLTADAHPHTEKRPAAAAAAAEPAAKLKKQDTKDTPDKAAMKPSAAPISIVDSDDEVRRHILSISCTILTLSRAARSGKGGERDRQDVTNSLPSTRPYTRLYWGM